MKLIFITALLAATPFGAPQWIKINEVEHAVPPYMTPDQYYQSVTGRPRPVHTTYPIQQSSLQQYSPQQYSPRQYTVQSTSPAPIIAVPRPSNLFTSRFTTDAYPIILPTPAPLPSMMRRPYAAAQRPLPTTPIYSNALPVRPFNSVFANNQMSFQKQWVKIREGTDPIEVPAGRDPHEFLNGLKFGAGFRNLAGGKKCKKGNCGIFVPPPPPPIPVAVKTVAIFPLPRPIVPYNKGKMTFAPPPPPPFMGYSKGAAPFAPYSYKVVAPSKSVVPRELSIIQKE